jgi:LmbE family N-acetylglucosaminyl deacetylase
MSSYAAVFLGSDNNCDCGGFGESDVVVLNSRTLEEAIRETMLEYIDHGGHCTIKLLYTEDDCLQMRTISSDLAEQADWYLRERSDARWDHDEGVRRLKERIKKEKGRLSGAGHIQVRTRSELEEKEAKMEKHRTSIRTMEEELRAERAKPFVYPSFSVSDVSDPFI